MSRKKFVLDIDDLESFEFPFDDFFYLVVKHKSVKYQFLVRLASSNRNLICFGSGAYVPERLTPPIFRRHSWQDQFEESVIYYNDPTLYVDPDIRIGWGVGKNDEWYIPVINDIILKLAGKNDIKAEDILFFGSSGGGFTAIILSTLIKNSEVMVNNPQLFLCNYQQGHFNQMIKSCFDEQDLDTIFKKYGYRFDVLEIFRREKHIPKIIYLVNTDSEPDINNQLLPFIKGLDSFEEFDDQVKILLYKTEGGHQGIYDMDKTISLIKNHFQDDEKVQRDSINSMKTKRQLEIIAHTRSYRFAYFLYRFNHEFLKGKSSEKKNFLRWIYNKLTRKESGLEYKYNPLMELVKK